MVNDNVNKNSNDNKLIKIKRPQGGGTVRSIPIKDYQASIAHNIGTLRRSVAPQSQFETLVSEPEKSVYMASKKIIPTASNLHHRTASQTTCIAAQMEANNNRKRSLCHFCNSQRDPRGCCCADPNKNTEENRYFSKTEDQRSQDGSDIDEYFHRGSRRRFSSSYDRQPSRCTRESSGNTVMITACTKDGRMMEDTDALQVAEGHVGQKISAYEQNTRHSLRGPNPRYRSLFEVRGHRSIGVPLVGMHNACGLPVVASWHNHELLDPLRIARTVKSVYKSPRTVPNVRRRTQKRKAPQPDRAMIHSRDDRNVTRSAIKSMVYPNAVNVGERSRRRRRRSSFTATKGSLSSKNSFKRTIRSKRHGIKVSSLVDTFGRKSMKLGSAKRTTLYAKDDGEEAVQVLKSLCLNPLARANPETDMMW